MYTRVRIALAVAALLMLVPAAARAQSTYDWSGPYAGAVIGGSSAALEYREPDDGDSDFDADLGGFAAGVLAGFNRVMNGYVVGLELDLGMASGSHEPDEDDDINPYSALDLGMSTHVRGRIGFARQRSLFFIGIGLAGLGVDLDDIDEDFGDDSATHWGWTIGGGIEHVIGERLRLRAEFLHDALGDKDYTISAPAGPFFPSYDAEVGASANIFRGGVVYRF